MNGRPNDLGTLQRDALHQVPGTRADRRREGARTLSSAREFRTTAQLCRAEGIRLPVISNLHEAARLTITAVAAARGLRFARRRFGGDGSPATRCRMRHAPRCPARR